MNNYNVNDKEFINSNVYKEFLAKNPGLGYLRIRAYTASQAVPISGMNIVVSTLIGKENVTFFEGTTNESGIIDNIALPAPKANPNDMDVPNKITYNITATYGDRRLLYKVDIYENIIVIQNINVIPESQVGEY